MQNISNQEFLPVIIFDKIKELSLDLTCETILFSNQLSVKQPKNLPLAIVNGHFEYYFGKADSFLSRFNLMFEKGKFSDAAFDLHQVAESCYKAILLVFSNRIPREHFLEILSKESEKYYSQIGEIFNKLNPIDMKHFKLLEYAYIGGRYDQNYSISKEELEFLLVKITKLLAISLKICKARIDILKD